MIATPAQEQAGLAAAQRVKDDPRSPSFTRDMGPYVKAIYEAMTQDHLMPAPTTGAKETA
jgi:hypothetical protein